MEEGCIRAIREIRGQKARRRHGGKLQMLRAIGMSPQRCISAAHEYSAGPRLNAGDASVLFGVARGSRSATR